MLRIDDRLGSYVIAAGEPWIMSVQMKAMSGGAIIDWSTRRLVQTFYAANREQVAQIEGVYTSDATGAYFAFIRDGAFSEGLFGQSLQVELAERLLNGRNIIAAGSLSITPTAAGITTFGAIIGRVDARFSLYFDAVGLIALVEQDLLPYLPAIVAPPVTLGTLTTSGTLRVGTASNGSVIGATAGSTIIENVAGFAVNSADRTYTYDGTGPAGTVADALTETHPNATNSGRQSPLTLALAPIVLAELALSAASVTENTGAGSTIGGVLGKTAGSALSLANNAGSRFALSGTTIMTGAIATDYETARSHGIVIRETLDGAFNSPRDTPLTIAVNNAFEQPSLRALMLSTTALTIGTASTGAINEAATGSTIAAAGLPAGLTINGPARTWTWSGNGAAGKYPIVLTEELGDSPNSPRDSAIDVTITPGVVTGDMTALRVRDATPLDPDGGTPAVGIDGNGWVAEVTLKGLTAPAATSDADALFNPQKLELLVADPGFDANLAPTTVYRRIKGRALLRKQYKTAISDPRQRFISQTNGDMVVMVALSDQLYAGSTIVSAKVLAGFYANGGAASNASTAGTVANASTYPYRKPTAFWLNHQHLRASADLPVEMAAFHRHAMGGRQIAGIRFQARDTTGNLSVEQVSTSTALSSLVTAAGASRPECHKATIPLANLAQGELCYLNAKVYPWIGDASAVYDLSTDGTYTGLTPIASVSPHTRLRFVCDKAGTYSALACLSATKTYNRLAVAATPGNTVDPLFAFDGNYTTGLGFLCNEGANDQWVGMAFPYPIEIGEVRIWASGHVANCTFNNFDLQWSDDGTTWTTKGATQIAETWTTRYTQTQAFAPGGSAGDHRYWRIKQNGKTPGTHTGAQEVEFALTPGGANIVYGLVTKALADARKLPFVDLNLAVQRIQAYNATKAAPTHNDYAGATVYLSDDGLASAEHGALSNYPASVAPGATWIEFRPDPANTGTAIWTGKAAVIQTPPMMRMVGVTLRRGQSANFTMFNPRDGGATNTAMISLDGCYLTNTDGGLAGGEGVYGFGIQYRSNLTSAGAATLDVGPSASIRDQIALALGCVSPIKAAFAPVFAGNSGGIWAVAVGEPAGTDEPADGYFFVNNAMRFLTGYSYTLRSTTRPTVFAQNLFEFAGANGGVVGTNFAADGVTAPVYELLEMHNTLVGDRGSRMYSDAEAARGVVKDGVSIGNIVDNWNYKSDTFEGGHPGNTGNWRYGYQLGLRSNVSLKGSRAGNAPDASNPLPGNYLGNAWEPDYSLPFVSATHAMVAGLFTNWQARNSTGQGVDGAGGGDYHLTGSSNPLYAKVPAAVAALDAGFTSALSGAVFSFDLDGRSRQTTGGGAVGCYERA